MKARFLVAACITLMSVLNPSHSVKASEWDFLNSPELTLAEKRNIYFLKLQQKSDIYVMNCYSTQMIANVGSYDDYSGYSSNHYYPYRDAWEYCQATAGLDIQSLMDNFDRNQHS